MNRQHLATAWSFSRLACLAGFALLGTGCYGEIDAGDPGAYPPPSYLATAQPVYYGGRPNYYYNGHWAYRDAGGRWNTYRSPPRELEQRRAAPQPQRRTYERAEAPREARGPERR